jgi:hypothetical protein
MTPKLGSYCQHRYGGLYVIRGVSSSTIDKSKWVVYEHVYPFDRDMWHRPYEEFTDGRFRIITEEEFLDIAESNDREAFKLQIGNNKAAAKK